MKLINGFLNYEEIDCFQCDGTKMRTRGILCPNWDKVVGAGKKCSCGAKNRHSHKVIGEDKVPCESCDATGRHLETAYDYLPKEIYTELPMEVFTSAFGAPLQESMFGMGIVGGATDYGRMLTTLKDKGTEEVIKQIKEEYWSRQAISFLKDKNDPASFCKSLRVVVRSNDYSVYPVFE